MKPTACPSEINESTRALRKSLISFLRRGCPSWDAQTEGDQISNHTHQDTHPKEHDRRAGVEPFVDEGDSRP